MFFQLHSWKSPKSKNPPPDRFWRWVSVILLKIALLHHPFPSSRRHVIRVDMPVPVDVIRFAFWTRVFMKSKARKTTHAEHIGRMPFKLNSKL
jgi:hypothetical protein